MSELLAPAGNIDAFYAAISNGADAIYVGLNSFSARAYANNFDIDTLKLITEYAHLRNVKVFVAMNTILFEHELNMAFKTVDLLASINIDAIIVQDLALLNYITSHYNTIEAHISTQVGIDDLDGIKLVKSLGAKRVVLAREVNVEKIKEFKKNCKIQLETFIHGALCVSYSGNCFMSGLLGMRSGNRGRCVGCCRKIYTLNNKTTNKTYPASYLFSMKDLNVSNDINKLKMVDSFKIEGRMKEPSYVAGIVRYYRDILDGNKTNTEHIYKNFQRTFTKGYILGEDPKDIVNSLKPNNYGYLIGKVIRVAGKKVTIKLNKPVCQNDQIRIETNKVGEEVSFPLVKIYDQQGRLINESDNIINIEIKEKVEVGNLVYKTKDIKYLNEINKTYPKEFKRLPIDIIVQGSVGKPLILYIKYETYSIKVESNYIIEPAKSKGITDENFKDLLSKLNDTPYYLDNIFIDFESNAFVPLKIISSLKRDAINKLNNERLKFSFVKKDSKKLIVPSYDKPYPTISVQVSNDEQYDACLKMGITDIYYDNIVPRNNVNYRDLYGNLLVGGLNGVYHYKDTNTITTDYSLNVVNSKSVALLHSLGVDKVTLSYEINKDSINDLVDNYLKEFDTYPNIEVIAYGRLNLMVTKYCPLRKLNMCGDCKKNQYTIKDDIAEFPIKFNNDCTITILNSKTLNLVDDLHLINGISSYRLVFTDESKDQVINIIKQFQYKLNNINSVTKFFDNQKDTRGHFNKEIQ
ncbi:MAG: U32 family peptidase [Bacilli bacterium]|nr:U32 family peptidase [Bacilli bacterium]